MTKLVAGINDFASTNPDLAAEWHPIKNGTLTPEDISCGSNKRVWWLGKCGHEWQAIVYSRAYGASCPICSGKRVFAGFNDLATKNPTLASEWHPTKNDGLSPQNVAHFSRKKVWWLGKCGHEWQAAVNNRSRGSDCPICAAKRVIVGQNDLATNPSLTAEWHPTKNDGLTPQDITLYSNKKVWWLGACGHEWQATVSNRSFGTGCPYCAKRGRPQKKTIEYKNAE